MWGYLVVISGAFFYTTGALLNAKATPNTTQLQSKITAESMFVWHKKGQELLKAGAGPFYSASYKATGYEDARWQTRTIGSCQLTYKVFSQNIPSSQTLQSIAVELAPYINRSRSVGYIDNSGMVMKSTKGPDPKWNGTNDFTATPFIFEC